MTSLSARPDRRWTRAGSSRSVLLATALIVAAIASGPGGQSGTPPIELISATPGGVPGGGEDPPSPISFEHGPSHISADNRYVVFASASAQLVPGDVNGHQDVFLRDRLTATTTIVSLGTGGQQANGPSGEPVISADGRFVAFASMATNLDARDTNGTIDIFVRNLTTGATTIVSLSSLGAVANFGAFDPSISGDGRYIVFASSSNTLVPGDTNVFNTDVFVRDTIAGTTQRVSLRPDGSQIVRADSHSPSISANGRRIAFAVDDSALAGPPPASDGPNLHEGIYLRDLDASTTTLLSVRPDGTPADFLILMDPVISANGRFVSFTSWEDLDAAHPDSHLEPDGAKSDVFVRDLDAQVTHKVSFPFNGPEEGFAGSGTISGDGRYVAYLADLDDMVRVHVRDRVAGTTSVVTAPGGIPVDNHASAPAISEDGQIVFFQSYATNLVPGDTNDLVDVFLFHLAPQADLSLTLQASTLTPAPDSDITLTVTVINAGPSDAAGVAVRVPLPPGLSHQSDDGGGSYDSASGIWSAGSMTSGSTTTLGIVARFTAFTPVSVTAQVSASSIGDPDSTPDNDNPAEDDQRTVQLTPALADLSLTLAANTTTPVVNSHVQLTTTVANGGPVAASGVAVRMPLPAGLAFVSATPAAAYDSGTGVWTVPALASGATETLQVVARATSVAAVDVVAQVILSNEADPDSTPGNDDPAEDDQAAVRITPTASAGIIVNDAGRAVDGSDGLCTLIEAIVAANTDLPSGNALGECAGGSGADTIHLRALSPPYTLNAVHNSVAGPNGLPQVSSDITIEGGGAAIERSAVPGTPAFRLFAVFAASRLVLNHVTVRNGAATTPNPAFARGGGILNLGVLELNNGSIVRDNAASCDGGGIYTQGPLVVRGSSLIENNAAGCSGGGIAGFFAGAVTVADSTLRANSAAGGGGGFFIHGTTTATMTGTLVDGNTAVAEGGGVFTHNADANLSITNSQIVNNIVSAGHGGGISNGRVRFPGSVFIAGGTMTLTGVTIANNRSTGGWGGGIANAGLLTVTSSTISDNQSSSQCGGGVFNASQLVLITTIVTRNSTSTGTGGAGLCAIGPATLAVTASTISANVAGGDGGGVGLFSGPTATFTNSVVVANVGRTGGGIFSSNQTLVLDNTVVQQNGSSTSGGGLIVLSSRVTLRNNTRVLGNTAATSGGGIYVAGAATVLTMEGGTIDDNVANGSWFPDGGGGGLANFDTTANSSVNLNGVTVSNNRAPNFGEGGGIFNRGTININGGVIAANHAGASGGGLANGSGGLDGGVATLTNVTVENNTAADLGGGVSALSPAGSVTLNNSTVRGNSAESYGGGIASYRALTMSGGTLSGNNSGGGGGLVSAGTTSVTAVTISANSASFAAGIWVSGGTTRITNSTLSGNTATLGAGAIFATGFILPDGTRSTRVELIASTIADNTGNPGGIETGTVDIVATGNILAANHRPDSTVSECHEIAGSVWAQGVNMVGLDFNCLMTQMVMAGSARGFLVDPAIVFTTVLGPLADNGGPTRTHALLPGSFAIDASDMPVPGFPYSCPPSDQRGLPRPVDGGSGVTTCDLGSVEQQDPLPMATPALASIAPESARAGDGATWVVLNGAGFSAHGKARWNGAERVTFPVGPSLLRMGLLPADLNTIDDITIGLISVTNPGGASSNALPFTIVSSRVFNVTTQIAPPGSTAIASVLPMLAGQHGLSALVSNSDPLSDPVTVTVASYSMQPVGGTIFAAAGRFFDIQVTGADPTDSLAARFYYPSTVTGGVEAGLQLQYWTGAAWAPVVGSGGAAPQKNISDNLDATFSGGRFALTLDGTSTPAITALSGTVFALVSATDTVPPVTIAARTPTPTGHWHRTEVIVTLTATDDGSGVALTEFKLDHQPWQTYAAPIRIAADGVHTLLYRSRDVAGNLESTRELTVRIDTTPPVLKLHANPRVLWPPDGRLHDVDVRISAKDVRSGLTDVTLVAVASNDGDSGPPDMVGWRTGTADTRGRLRAGESRRGRFRIYLLTYEAADRAGNRVRATATVISPGFQ